MLRLDMFKYIALIMALCGLTVWALDSKNMNVKMSLNVGSKGFDL